MKGLKPAYISVDASLVSHFVSHLVHFGVQIGLGIRCETRDQTMCETRDQISSTEIE